MADISYDITFDVTRLIPHFLLADRNGYAMAKAIQAGVQAMNDIVAASVLETVGDRAGAADSLPEWRLDELAWEYGISYDHSASIETKRAWLRTAFLTARAQGTAAGLARYLQAAFATARVEEAADYGGDPYHFRVTVEGPWTAERAAWAVRAVEQNKNVRSVLDRLGYQLPEIEIPDQRYAAVGLYGSAEQRFGATENPDLSGNFLTDEADNHLADEGGWLLNDA